MRATIYHNPRCSKSRQALELLRQNGIEPDIIEYLKTPLTLTELQDLYAALNLDSVLPMVRTKEADFKTAALSKDSSNEDLLAALVHYPKLLERPVVVTEKGARICRPPEKVKEIL